MALELRTRAVQKQSMTAAMWLGLNLLALPVNELKEAIKKEAESNPALEPVLPPIGGRLPTTTTDYLENVADDAGESLDEHLMSELRMSGVDGRELELCRAIVAEIDRDGRFQGSIPDLIMVTGANEEELETARRKIMDIDPKGCGARSLEECYLAQLDQIPAAKREKVRKSISVIAAMLEGKAAPTMIDSESVRLLKRLDAFPGRQYDFRRAEYVVPDIRVDEDGDIEVDQRDIPELRISPKYVAMARDHELDKETRKFAAERVRRAREFRTAVIKRQETVAQIAELAISGQPGFMTDGVAGLRKLTMCEVAKAAKCAIATVSRAAARKYVKTPRGTFPLRRFFVLVDQKPIEKLRDILAGPDHLTDRQVSELMAEAGFKMARRTVAKYRARLSK